MPSSSIFVDFASLIVLRWVVCVCISTFSAILDMGTDAEQATGMERREMEAKAKGELLFGEDRLYGPMVLALKNFVFCLHLIRQLRRELSKDL
jgi:hypothetical protein